MKVLLINGSPNEHGCTYTALCEAADVFSKNGIETEILYLGKAPVAGCIACGACRSTGRCFVDDKANEVLAKLDSIDGLIDHVVSRPSVLRRRRKNGGQACGGCRFLPARRCIRSV